MKNLLASEWLRATSGSPMEKAGCVKATGCEAVTEVASHGPPSHLSMDLCCHPYREHFRVKLQTVLTVIKSL